MSEFIKFIDDSRIKCDKLILTAEAIKSSPEMTLAWRSLQMAKAWLGKAKGFFGKTSPYITVSEIAIIPETAERHKGELNISGDKLKDINSIRSEIESVLLSFKDYENKMSDKYINEVNYALNHLEEARMWYGFELGNMRELHKNSNK